MTFWKLWMYIQIMASLSLEKAPRMRKNSSTHKRFHVPRDSNYHQYDDDTTALAPTSLIFIHIYIYMYVCISIYRHICIFLFSSVVLEEIFLPGVKRREAKDLIIQYYYEYKPYLHFSVTHFGIGAAFWAPFIDKSISYSHLNLQEWVPFQTKIVRTS